MPTPDSLPAGEAEPSPPFLRRLNRAAGACTRLLVLLVLAVAVLPVVRRFGKTPDQGMDMARAGSVLGGAILATALGSAACVAGLAAAAAVLLVCGGALPWAGVLALVLAMLWYLGFPGDLLLGGLGRLVLAWKRRPPAAENGSSAK